MTEFAEPVSRRALLSKAGAAALGAVAAGTLLNAREAQARTDTFDTVRCTDLIADAGGVRRVGVLGKGVIGVRGDSSTARQAGVYGEHTAKSGPGVMGRGEYGGLFEGSKSALLLIPGDKKGYSLGAHTKGELHIDTNGRLLVCRGAGNPGRWSAVRYLDDPLPPRSSEGLR